MIGIKLKIATGKSGFTLAEILVSVALFSVIILSSTQIFKLVIDGQRSALASQNVQEGLKYFLEVIGKEIRMAQKDDGVCGGVPDDKIFYVSENSLGDVLAFKNYYGQCVTYVLVADNSNPRFWIGRDSEAGFISPGKISLDDLQFVLTESTSTQPVVTVNLRAHALSESQFSSAMTIQTSLTSRYYK
jgi:prepilin-type N-terminal cleavage/methylation domain-containing protein